MQRRQLQYFVEVVDCGSISAAAQKLFVAQPSLSRTISAMEHDMDCALLERTGRGVRPTQTGWQLYYYARSILDKFQMLEKLRDTKNTNLVSRLHVAIAHLYLKDALLLQVYRHMDAQDTELCFYETTLEPALEKVASLGAEIGLVVANDTQLPVLVKMAAGKNVRVTPLDGPRPMCVHVGKEHPLAQSPSLQCSQLFRYPRVLLPGDFFSHLNQTLLDDLRAATALPRRTITVNSYHTVLRMLRSTDGYFVGNPWQSEELRCSQICSIPLEDVPARMNLLLLQREREELSVPVRRFLSSFLQDLELPEIYQN